MRPKGRVSVFRLGLRFARNSSYTGLVHNGADTREQFLPLIAESGSQDRNGVIDVLVSLSTIMASFPSHLRNYPFDPRCLWAFLAAISLICSPRRAIR